MPIRDRHSQARCWQTSAAAGTAANACSLKNSSVVPPDLHDKTEILLDLIYAEVVLRREVGERPMLDEYVVRFPALADELRTQFEVDAAIGVALTQPAGPAEDCPPPPAPPGYEILEHIGRGGMGVVYRARQIKLNRIVALKMIRSGGFHDSAERQRFEAEARAIAKLSHPNIIQIYEVGEANGLPFLALEYVPGKSLADAIAGTPLPPRPAAALIATLARAIQHAHDAGVLHRDLKPANILLSTADVGTRNAEREADDLPLQLPSSAFRIPKVTDFGLAKQIGSDGVTRAGDFVGTPSYAAPEQAFGRLDIGPPADVYALGAILYQMLTGRPPFAGATALETIDQVRFNEVVPPSRLRPNVPRDLETIVLKSLQKEPAKRYASAISFAEDLERFLEGRAIRARPVSVTEKVVKWCRRKPGTAGMLAAILVLVIASVTTITVLWRQAIGARDSEGRALTGEREQREQAEARSAALLIANARYAWLTDDLDGARAALEECPADYRTAEWSALNRACSAARVIVGPTGVSVEAIATANDGQRIAIGTAFKGIVICELATGGELRRFVLPNQYPQSLSFGDDGRLMGAMAMTILNNGVRLDRGLLDLMDPSNGRAVAAWVLPTRPLRFLISPDGTHAFDCGNKSRKGSIRDAVTGQLLCELTAQVGNMTQAAYSPDGRYLLTAALPQELSVWDAKNGQLSHRFDCPETFFGVSAIALSPDGKTAAVNGPNSARSTEMCLLYYGGKPRRFDSQLSMIAGCCFSPDGKWLAAHDNSSSVIRVWDAETGREEIVFRGVPSTVRCITFMRDSRHIVAGYRDGRVVVWDISR